MGNRSSAINLSARSCAVLRIITDIAAAGGYTPTNQEIDAKLQAAGWAPQSRSSDNRNKHCAVAYELLRLAQAGRIELIGQNRCRAFLVVGLGLQTKVREAPTRTRAAHIEKMHTPKVVNLHGWPERGGEHAASYDRAVAARVFAFHEVPGNADQEPRVHQVAHPAQHRMSLTGCSAAEACR